MVTGDGAIDTQEHPNEQEALTASLHFAELVAALGLLAVGGCVFLKAFTIFEHSTFAMLYLCAAFFDRVRLPRSLERPRATKDRAMHTPQVSGSRQLRRKQGGGERAFGGHACDNTMTAPVQVEMFKPATSKANNSETYIVCLGFQGIEDAVLHSLLDHVGATTFDNAAMLPRKAMPSSFVDSVAASGRFFAGRTKTFLEDAYLKSVASPLLQQVLRDGHAYCTKKWFDIHPVERLRPNHRLAQARAPPSGRLC